MQIIAAYKTWLEIGFFVFMVIYWTMSFTTLYHLIRFGVGTLPKKIAIMFLAGSLVLSIVTVLFFAQMFK